MQYTEMVKRRYFKLLSLTSSDQLKARCGSHSSRCAHRIHTSENFVLNQLGGRVDAPSAAESEQFNRLTKNLFQNS